MQPKINLYKIKIGGQNPSKGNRVRGLSPFLPLSLARNNKNRNIES